MKHQRTMWQFLAVTLLMGINLLTLPFQVIPMILGGLLAAFFIWTNHLGERYKWWLGGVWMLLAAVIMVFILSNRELTSDMQVTVSMFSFLASGWYAFKHYRRENTPT